MTRLPQRGPRPVDESKGWRPGNGLIAAIVIFIVIVGPYLAFTKHIPFTGYGYELTAAFRNSANIAINSPVRVAGVNVGKVISTSRNGNAGTVSFTVEDSARPIHTDAFATVRPRIFLEGNFFVELDPGTPGAPELDSGDTIPVTHTATAVQFDQILTALQSPVRANLGRFLEAYGRSLVHKPTAAEDRDQTPLVKGVSAAGALNLAFKYGGPAGRYSAVVLDAFRGTEPRDLQRLIAASGRAFGALGSNERRLAELVSNWNTFTGALASESDNLALTVKRLAPTLRTARGSFASLNAALPPLRTWARYFEPAVAQLPATIRASAPWLAEARPLLTGREAGGTAKYLRASAPGLAAASYYGNNTLGQTSLLSRCSSDVLVPTGDVVIDDDFSTGQPNYREFFYTFSNFAGESQSFDGNGAFLRLLTGAGDVLATAPNPDALATENPDTPEVGFTISDPLGTQPALAGRPPFNPEASCFQQPVPDVNGGEVGPPSPKATP